MRRALESVYQIISSLSHSSGQGYFDTFVSEIANAVGADFVLVSGKDQAGLFFTVHAAYPASLDINSYSFPLADARSLTPLLNVRPPPRHTTRACTATSDVTLPKLR